MCYCSQTTHYANSPIKVSMTDGLSWGLYSEKWLLSSAQDEPFKNESQEMCLTPDIIIQIL